jgi:hypothetical protein
MTTQSTATQIVRPTMTPTTPSPTPTPTPSPTPADRGARLKAALPGLALNILAPTCVYFVLDKHMGNTAALAISGAISVVTTLGGFIRNRKVSALGVLSILGFAAALAQSAFSGGSPLVLELEEPVLTGILGLICLTSVAIRKPVLLSGLRIAARDNPALADRMKDATGPHKITVVTGIIGATLVAHSATLAALAFTEPTNTYVTLSKLIGLPILALGLATLMWYRRR